MRVQIRAVPATTALLLACWVSGVAPQAREHEVQGLWQSSDNERERQEQSSGSADQSSNGSPTAIDYWNDRYDYDRPSRRDSGSGYYNRWDYDSAGSSRQSAGQEAGAGAPTGYPSGISSTFAANDQEQNRSGEPADAQITQAVKQALAHDRHLRGQRLHVQTHHGAVELTGRVDTLQTRQRAVDLANAVRGVTGVYDEIRLAPASEPDARLADAFAHAAEDSPMLENTDVHARAQDGILTLSGEVHSWQQRQSAEDLAKSLRGVRHVRDELTVHRLAHRSDEEIAADIRAGLNHDARLANNLIQVEVHHGRVNLRGSVDSTLEKDMAIADAEVMNVRSISTDQLRVVPSEMGRRFSDQESPDPQLSEGRPSLQPPSSD